MSKIKNIGKEIGDFTVENIGKRGILIVAIIVGIIVLAIGLIMSSMSLSNYYDLLQMANLGVISDGSTEYNYRLYEIYKSLSTDIMIAQIGAIVTAIFLLIAGISPLSGKGTPYFSEYVRLGLCVFAAVLIFVAIYLYQFPSIFVI